MRARAARGGGSSAEVRTALHEVRTVVAVGGDDRVGVRRRRPYSRHARLLPVVPAAAPPAAPRSAGLAATGPLLIPHRRAGLHIGRGIQGDAP